MKKQNDRRVELEVYEYLDEEGISWWGIRDEVDVYGVKVTWGYNMSERNARLFSAALNLLDAAKHALPGCVGESAKLLTDAIAKAEGHEKTK